ncbi:Potassium transporter, partial [Thalictrum thalictroides]
TEAMFADLGHFSVRSVQISFMGVVCPAILCAYSGQAAYLTKFPNHVYETFYDSIPDPLYWPTFVVAVCASIIASQAMISGAFAIISQSLRLGCFPTVKVVHTSAKYEGQVYIPEINFMIMIACVLVTVSFRTTTQIGNAYGKLYGILTTFLPPFSVIKGYPIVEDATLYQYEFLCNETSKEVAMILCAGIAVVGAEAITTVMVTIIMLIIWKTSLWKIALFFVALGTMEATYLSAVLYKFTQGGYLPLAISFFVTTIMSLWHYVHKKRYMFELQNKVSSESIRDLAQNPNITRVPGIGFLYSELVQGIPPIFPHFISNIPSIHSVLVFVSIKYIPISKVAMAERFLFRQVEPREYRMFRCVVRYGYKDDMEGHKEFEHLLVEHLKEFIRHEYYILEAAPTEQVTSQQLDAGRLIQSGQLVKDIKTRKPTSSTVHTEESLRQTDNLSGSSGSICLAATGNCSNNSHNRMITEPIQGVEEEIQFIQKAMDQGVVYLLGETEVATEQNSSTFKQIAVNYVYDFLRRNFRQGEKIMSIPRSKLLRVGMLYEI